MGALKQYYHQEINERGHESAESQEFDYLFEKWENERLEKLQEEMKTRDLYEKSQTSC